MRVYSIGLLPVLGGLACRERVVLQHSQWRRFWSVDASAGSRRRQLGSGQDAG